MLIFLQNSYGYDIMSFSLQNPLSEILKENLRYLKINVKAIYHLNLFLNVLKRNVIFYIFLFKFSHINLVINFIAFKERNDYFEK